MNEWMRTLCRLFYFICSVNVDSPVQRRLQMNGQWQSLSFVQVVFIFHRSDCTYKYFDTVFFCAFEEIKNWKKTGKNEKNTQTYTSQQIWVSCIRCACQREKKRNEKKTNQKKWRDTLRIRKQFSFPSDSQQETKMRAKGICVLFQFYPLRVYLCETMM